MNLLICLLLFLFRLVLPCTKAMFSRREVGRLLVKIAEETKIKQTSLAKERDRSRKRRGEKNQTEKMFLNLKEWKP